MLKNLLLRMRKRLNLLLKYSNNKNVELRSNEWKNSKVTAELKLKQQSKNLRVDASIVNSLLGFGVFFSSIF